MGRITINGTQAGFSCKKEVSLALWDVKTNRAKGKSEEARTLNQELDNIKAQITRHYQYICDHDSFVTVKKVNNRYVGFSEECHTLMNLFREQHLLRSGCRLQESPAFHEKQEECRGYCHRRT